MELGALDGQRMRRQGASPAQKVGRTTNNTLFIWHLSDRFVVMGAGAAEKETLVRLWLQGATKTQKGRRSARPAGLVHSTQVYKVFRKNLVKAVLREGLETRPA